MTIGSFHHRLLYNRLFKLPLAAVAPFVGNPQLSAIPSRFVAQMEKITATSAT